MLIRLSVLYDPTLDLLLQHLNIDTSVLDQEAAAEEGRTDACIIEREMEANGTWRSAGPVMEACAMKWSAEPER